MKKMLPTAHWETAKGTPKENIHYCSKPIQGCSCKHCVGPPVPINLEKFKCFGEVPIQGTRTDIRSALEAVAEGKSELEIANTFPNAWTKYYRAFERYRWLATTPRDFQTTCTVYWGPPGSGKSYRALFESANNAFWVARPRASLGGIWWDGYTGQPTVVFDEFYGWLSRDSVQRLVDRYPLNVETKGGTLSFRSKHIIFTSNIHPLQWWKIGLGAMRRRFTRPIGQVLYIGNDEYPKKEDYLAFLGTHEFETYF